MLKQVIVIRHDLKMRLGKCVAQGAHASCLVMLEMLSGEAGDKQVRLADEWLKTGMRKICVRVDSEEELVKIYESAKESGVATYLVTDAGHTEFHGIPTKTAVCIGPDYAEKIDLITGGLKLL